jgi:hypothetical protein
MRQDDVTWWKGNPTVFNFCIFGLTHENTYIHSEFRRFQRALRSAFWMFWRAIINCNGVVPFGIERINLSTLEVREPPCNHRFNTSRWVYSYKAALYACFVFQTKAIYQRKANKSLWICRSQKTQRCWSEYASNPSMIWADDTTTAYPKRRVSLALFLIC